MAEPYPNVAHHPLLHHVIHKNVGDVADVLDHPSELLPSHLCLIAINTIVRQPQGVQLIIRQGACLDVLRRKL